MRPSRLISWKSSAKRKRKCLLHTREIRRLQEKSNVKGLTLVPLRVYFKDGRCKVELGLAKGKKVHDKRADMARKTADREAKAAVGRGRKGDT